MATASLAAVAAVLAGAPPAGAQIPGVPPVAIPGVSLGNGAPGFTGKAVKPRPVKARAVPRHPFMAPNGRSNLHNDAFQSDAYRNAGPLGKSPMVNSTLFARECASVAFDSRGRIVTICVGLDRPVLAVLHPRTLATVAAMPLPVRRVDGGNPFTDFSGGGYFYLDHKDRAVLSTNDGRLYTVAVRGDRLRLVSDVDLRPAVGDGKIISALPDWRGRVWFASKSGVVGWTDRQGTLVSRDIGEVISNSFAVGPGGGVYVVSDAALYRFEAARRTEAPPRVVWRQRYPNTGRQESGQTSPGSGTTPTLLGRRYVAITDNADPLAVVVMNRGRKPRKGRVVCRVEVLREGSGSTDQSLVGVGRSLMVENNFGYDGVVSVEAGSTTQPGLERVDIKPRRKLKRNPRRNCKRRWRSDEIAPSVVPKLSLGAGLLYTYTKPEQGDADDPWYFTALDWRTGKTRFKRLAGYGLGFNNNYAPVTIAPDGAAYVGVLGGLVRIADSR